MTCTSTCSMRWMWSSGWFRGDLSHYHKFSILLHHHKKLPEVHSVVPNGHSAEAQAGLQVSYGRLIFEMNENFNSTGAEMTPSFWDAMFGLGGALIAVWESGACPDLEIGA